MDTNERLNKIEQELEALKKENTVLKEKLKEHEEDISILRKSIKTIATTFIEWHTVFKNGFTKMSASFKKLDT